jgi:hypothetical protein
MDDAPGLDPVQLQVYATRWRLLAGRWKEIAGTSSDPEAVRLRRTSQMALFAVHEIERWLARRGTEAECPPPEGVGSWRPNVRRRRFDRIRRSQGAAAR